MALAQVFLSHSGAQKGFVEQLNLDLKQCDRHAFFDKDRDCLPIGENFPHLILNAIQQCEVGVVVLSDEFLSTKWPKLELVEMVRRRAREGDRMILMPIFFGVSVEDLKVEENIRKWKAKWEKIAENDIRIDIFEWVRALKSLNSINGLVYNSKIGEVKFREEIVKAICSKVLPYLPWDDSHVQGKSHFIEVIESKKALVAATHEIRVGLYGVGGIGKTTACKVLCNHFEMEFYGKVCHVEVGKGTEMENLHMILKKFTKAQRKHLKELSLDECRTRLKSIKEKVFLAVDNVSSNSKVIEEARRYLGARYEHGSVLIVTARTLDQVKEVMDANDCFPMPEINEVEAKNLFRLHAEIKGGIDEEILDTCVDRCKFDKGKGDHSCHYVPLVLEVLGKHMRGSDPSTWVKKLQNDSNVFNRLREKEHPIFATFGISYDALNDEDKDLFLDVAIFHSTPNIYIYRDYGLGIPLHWNVYEWLRLLYDLRNIEEVKHRLNILKTKSLLEEVDDFKIIGMHDLWKEFALYEIEAKEKESRRWVCEHDIVRLTPESTNNEVELGESILIDGGWDNLERISILKPSHYLPQYLLSISSCPKLKALRVMSVKMEEVKEDLFELSKLRIMEIYHSHVQILSEMGQLKNLQVLIWINIGMESVHILEQIGLLKNLRILLLEIGAPTRIQSLDLTRLRSLQVAEIIYGGFTMLSLSSKLRVLDLSHSYKLGNCPGLDHMSGLEVLRLCRCPKLETLPNLQKLKNLKVLDILYNESLTQVSGLEDLVFLQQLKASSCSRLQALPNMSKLTNLQELDVEGCDMLECIEGMSNLIALQKLHITSNSLRNTPNSGKLMNLDGVTISGHTSKQFNQEIYKTQCSIAEEDDTSETNILFNIGASQSVDKIGKENVGFTRKNNGNGSSQKGDGSNQEGGDHDLVSIKEVNVCVSTESQQALDLIVVEHVLGSLKLKDIDCELKNLHKLTTLESLVLRDCGFKSLPDMGLQMRLKSLYVCGCKDLRSWDGVGGLELMEPNTDVKLQCNWTLAHLVKLELIHCSPIQLPDLSHFPQLTKLCLFGSRSPYELVNPGFALYCRGYHVKLKKLEVMNWRIIELPDLSHFPELMELSLNGMNQSLLHPEYESSFSRFSLYFQDGHVKLKKLEIEDWPIIELPDLSKFCLLGTLIVQDCQHLRSLTTSKPLSTLESLSLRGCKNLKVLPAISYMKDLRSLILLYSGITLNRHECHELSPGCKCYMDHDDWIIS